MALKLDASRTRGRWPLPAWEHERCRRRLVVTSEQPVCVARRDEVMHPAQAHVGELWQPRSPGCSRTGRRTPAASARPARRPRAGSTMSVVATASTRRPSARVSAGASTSPANADVPAPESRMRRSGSASSGSMKSPTASARSVTIADTSATAAARRSRSRWPAPRAQRAAPPHPPESGLPRSSLRRGLLVITVLLAGRSCRLRRSRSTSRTRSTAIAAGSAARSRRGCERTARQVGAEHRRRDPTPQVGQQPPVRGDDGRIRPVVAKPVGVAVPPRKAFSRSSPSPVALPPFRPGQHHLVDDVDQVRALARRDGRFPWWPTRTALAQREGETGADLQHRPAVFHELGEPGDGLVVGGVARAPSSSASGSSTTCRSQAVRSRS